MRCPYLSQACLGFRATPHASPVSGQQDGTFPQEALRRWNFLGDASRFVDFVAFPMKFLSVQRFLFRFHDAAFALKNGRPHWHLAIYHIDTNFNEGVAPCHSEAKRLVYWIDGMSAPKTVIWQHIKIKNANNFCLLKKLRVACFKHPYNTAGQHGPTLSCQSISESC